MLPAWALLGGLAAVSLVVLPGGPARRLPAGGGGVAGWRAGFAPVATWTDMYVLDADSPSAAGDPSSSGGSLELRYASQILERAPVLAPQHARLSSAGPAPLRLLQDLDCQLREVTRYLRPSAQASLRMALETAFLAHFGQNRRSGEPYITHPVEVARILAQTQMDKESVISGLLHDTVEDTELRFADVEALFGETVRQIVEGETKVSKLPKMVRDQVDAEALRDVAAGRPASRSAQRPSHPHTHPHAQAPGARWPTPASDPTAGTSPGLRTGPGSAADLAQFDALREDEPWGDIPAVQGAGGRRGEGGVGDGVGAGDSQLRASAADVAASAEDEQVENLRSMFIAMAEDWRIVVVKLADRLHNMRTLQHMPPAKQAATARETLQIFAPLAHRLGMWQYKTELSDLSFKYLFPAEFDEVQGYIERMSPEYDSTILSTQVKLNHMLSADEWLQGRIRAVHVTGRTKSVYSTWKKMQRHDCSIERVHDLVALRVVLSPEGVNRPARPPPRDDDDRTDGRAARGLSGDDAEERALCYHVLGKVHGCWTPLPRTLKDYISSPKPNGYRSLHTTVLVGTLPLEVQIRTLGMHNVAEYGAAAHWLYKEIPRGPSALPWLQIIHTWRAQVVCAHDFVRLVREELLGTRVFVFTRNGRILNLARGATLLDACYLLRTSLRSHGALVNGLPAAPSTILQNGDIVSLERREPLAHYESVLLSARAPPRPLAAAATMPEPHDPGRVAGLHHGLSSRGTASGGGFSREGGGPSPYSAHAAADQAGAAAWPVPAPSRGMESLPLLQRVAAAAPSSWALCQHCKPVKGDSLAGAAVDASCGAGVVHRADASCRALQRQLAMGGHTLVHGGAAQPALNELMAPVGVGELAGFVATIVVFVRDRRGILLDVSIAVTRGCINIIDVHSETLVPGQEAAFQFTVQVSEAAMLRTLIDEVERVAGVVKVVRGGMEEMMRESPAGFWANCALLASAPGAIPPTISDADAASGPGRSAR